MSKPEAFQGDYSGLKFVPSRKVAQIIIEIPLEHATSFVAAFGAPDASTTIPVAIARLDTSKAEKPKGGKLAQRAGILCSEGAFEKFLIEKMGLAFVNDVSPEHDCAAILRDQCGINSRSELDHNSTAANRFKDIEASYRAWLTVAA